MRYILAAWLLAVTCAHQRTENTDSTTAATIKETERSETSGTENTIETRTKSPSKIDTKEETAKYAWVPPPPDAPDAGYQWRPVETRRKERTANIGGQAVQKNTQAATVGKMEGQTDSALAGSLKTATTDKGDAAVGPTRTWWWIIGIGIVLVLALVAWLRFGGKKK